MNSENNEQEEQNNQNSFADKLNYALNHSQLTLEQLAKKANISRTNLQRLKKEGRPSRETLFKICDALQQNMSYRELTPLVFSGIGLPDSPEFFKTLPRNKYDTKTIETLTSRCIVTDILAERYYPTFFLKETIENLNNNIPYYYFLPRSKSEREWTETKLAANEIDSSGEYAKTLEEKAMVINCPDAFIYCRMRIDNVESSDVYVSASLGESSTPALYDTDPDVVSTLVHTLRIVVREAKLARKKGDREIKFHDKGIDMTFEIAN